MGRYNPDNKNTSPTTSKGRWVKTVKEPSGVSKVLSAVGNFGKELVKEGVGATVVRPVARTTEAITRLVAPNSLATKGYEAMSDAGESQNIGGIKVAPVKALGQGGGKQILGEGLETASWLYGGAEAKAGVKVLTKTAQLAAKKTFAEIAVKQIPELAKLGFIGSSAATIGNQLQKTAGTDDKIDWGQATKDIAIGTIATPLVGMALYKLFGTKASKILEARQALRDAEVVANKVKAEAMPVGTKFDNVPKPSAGNVIDNTFNPSKQTTTPNISTNEGAFVPTPKAIPTTPLEVRASKAVSKEQFIADEINFLNRTKQKIPSKLQEQASKTWDKMHPVADTSKVVVTPKLSKTSLANKGLNETPIVETPSTGVKVEQPKIDTNTLEFKQKVKENFDILNEKMPEEFNAKINEIYANKYAFDRTANPAFTESVALGYEKHPDGAAFSDAYHALFSNEINELAKTGDTYALDMIDKLADAKSRIGSISGQKLQANTMRIKDGIVDTIDKIKKGKFNELPKSVKKMFDRESNTGRKLVENEILIFKPTREIISEVVNKLMCP